MTDLPIEQIEHRCQAITRAGQPCQNRPLDGQRYCRVHAALASTSAPAAASDGEPAQQIGPPLGEEIPIANALPTDERAAADTAVQELEVEIRNQDERPESRDLAANTLRLIRQLLRGMRPEAFERALALIRENITSDYLDPDFWRGVGMVLRYQVEELSGLVQRRLRGEYSTDDFGMDQELIDLVRPFSAFMYRTYWRVSASGLEHVPSDGPALLLANHGGVLPWDSMMIATAVLEEHPSPRLVRSLYPPAFRTIPGAAAALAMFGQAADTPENAAQLLADGQLVCIFPEGAGALGKLFQKRYQLQRFRRNGSVGLAIQAGAPIVPVAVVGAEETYPVLADAQPLAQMLRLPFFPLTPLFPWLGPLGLLPLPTKWSIAFGEPISIAEYGPGAAEDQQLLQKLAAQVRERIQAMLDAQLAARPAVFSG